MSSNHFYQFQAGAPNPNPSPNPWLQGDTSELGFNSQQEMIDAMADPRYSAPGETGQHFRELVVLMMKQSTFGEVTSNEAKAAARKAQWLKEEDAQIVKEHVQALFNDPRYRTSALFRRQVREQIEANPHLAALVIPPEPTVKNFRMQLGEEDLKDAKKVLAEDKETARKAYIEEAVNEARRRAEAKYIDATSGELENDEAE